MEKIQKKSALAETAGLILAAHDRGEGLLWERYEKQLPLCAFTNNGLNCRKCFLGPCRINPFGDEPSLGVCGADRDQIVMENIFQMTLAGVLETAGSVRALSMKEADREFPDIAPELPGKSRERLGKLGILPVRKLHLLDVRNGYFSNKGYLSQTLKDLTRLGLIHFAFLTEAANLIREQSWKAPLHHPDGMNLLVCGEIPSGLIRSLQKGAEEKKANLFFRGTNGIPSLHALVDHGSPELGLGMKLNGIILSPSGFVPALEGLAKKYEIPVILFDGRPFDQIASEALEEGSRHFKRFPSASLPSQGPAPEELKGAGLKEALEGGRIQGIVILCGETNVKKTFFEPTLKLLESCLENNYIALLGGELGTQKNLLIEEMNRRIAGRFSAFSRELERDGLRPLLSFGPLFRIPGVVSALGDLVDRYPVIAGFPEFYRASTWAAAVSFLSLGFTVQIGPPLPFWGSPSITETLLKEWPRITGGGLLASPSLRESQELAEELVAFLNARKRR
jgi:hypothetical protein